MYLVKKRKKKKRKTPPAIFLLSLYFVLPTVFWFLLCFKVHSYLKTGWAVYYSVEVLGRSGLQCCMARSSIDEW
jgi:hypothetical protein